jgi:prevent-host-death family protein
MDVSAKELRARPGMIIEQAARGVDVVVTLRGKRVARIVPFSDPSTDSVPESSSSCPDELFGLWRDRSDLDPASYVRDLRKGRFA